MVRISHPIFVGRDVEAMIDSGAQPNVIKINVLDPSTTIDISKKRCIIGVSSEPIPTIGTIRLKIDEFVEDEFLVVAKNFPIPACVILDAHFCEINTAKIDFKTNIFGNGRVRIPLEISFTELIPGKSTKHVVARARRDITGGLIARTGLGIQGVYIPPCKVKNFGGEVLVPIQNDNLQRMEIRLRIVPLVTMEEKTYYKHWQGVKVPDYLDDDASGCIGPVPVHNQTSFLLDSIKQNNQSRREIDSELRCASENNSINNFTLAETTAQTNGSMNFTLAKFDAQRNGLSNYKLAETAAQTNGFSNFTLAETSAQTNGLSNFTLAEIDAQTNGLSNFKLAETAAQTVLQILNSRKPPRKQTVFKILHSRKPPRKQTAA